MKYLVMECHFSYAILLDEEGRFIKAANLHYETGQTVTDIIEMKEPEPVKKINYKWLTGLATIAACFVLLISTFLNNQTYASVFMVINPEVRIDVNRKNEVVGLEGMNEDGQDLIEGYSYRKKSLEPVMDELVDRAIEMGYLSSGEQITLTLDAEDDEWIITTGTELQTHIDEYLTDKMSVTIEISNPEVPASEPDTTQKPESVIVEQPQTIVIPTIPEDDGDSSYGISDYDDTSDEDENEDTDTGISNYSDDIDDSSSNYNEADDGASNYDDSADDNVSNYDDNADDSASNYDDSSSNYNNEPNHTTDDGVSGYDGDDGSDDGASSYSVTHYEEVVNDAEDSDDSSSNYSDSSDDNTSDYDNDDDSNSDYE